MRYDLNLVRTLCSEISLSARLDEDRVEIDLGQGAILCFQNAERDQDCLIGFLCDRGIDWHFHDNLMFVDGRGNCVELDYLNLLTSLKEGRVLICEREVEGAIIDRWLIHSEYNDEFKYVAPSEHIIVRRATLVPA